MKAGISTTSANFYMFCIYWELLNSCFLSQEDFVDILDKII